VSACPPHGSVLPLMYRDASGRPCLTAASFSAGRAITLTLRPAADGSARLEVLTVSEHATPWRGSGILTFIDSPRDGRPRLLVVEPLYRHCAVLDAGTWAIEARIPTLHPWGRVEVVHRGPDPFLVACLEAQTPGHDEWVTTVAVVSVLEPSLPPVVVTTARIRSLACCPSADGDGDGGRPLVVLSVEEVSGHRVFSACVVCGGELTARL
jgi:hypothetical protein